MLRGSALGLVIVTFAAPASPGEVSAQGPGEGPPPFFAASELPESASQVPEPSVVRRRGVRVEASSLEHSGSLSLNLFDDVTVTARRVPGAATDPAGTWVGRIEGRPEGQAILATRGAVLEGSVTWKGASYQIHSAGKGVHVIEEIDLSALLDAGDDARPVPARAPASTRALDNAVGDDGSLIDLLVVYTPRPASTRGARRPSRPGSTSASLRPTRRRGV